ncbi:type II secretion system ATPase GspE [Endozoicomonas ascidiicola]|uniref:type II secretion system ATPase GspE n=1 Tax=Endozoicomonas ascidiicola TaxID=1698521 RepID=UPI00082DD2B0|nr:type II secretion system ATPase GspE [Endozoicomonas ascidiicola]
MDTSLSVLEDRPSWPVKRLPFYFAKKHGVVLAAGEGGLTACYHQLPPLEIIAEVLRFSGQEVLFNKLPVQAFDDLLSAAYQGDSSEVLQDAAVVSGDMELGDLADSLPVTEDLLEQADDAPIIRLINALLTEAVREGASDIHIESFDQALVVRIRVDGLLKEILRLQRGLSSLLISRIKVMARLDIAEKRIPQDGRISLKVAGKEVDVRVSTLPSNNVERVVLRLLDKAAGRLDLSHLGMSDQGRQVMEQLLARPHGILLVTGPTGSGKTTSLYASLEHLNEARRNILTIEDPVEYNLDGIGQTQVNTKVDMTFARGLRAILRQDPDVVMVGEIRDSETVEISVQASLTGHLVLSTLHTNTAVGALTRLQDMGVEPFLLSSSLLGILAQRLVRVLCKHCRQPYPATTEEMNLMSCDSSTTVKLYRAVGCAECNQSGYRGRTGIYEILPIDEQVRRLIHSGAGEQAIVDHVRPSSPSLLSDGFRKVLAGETTLEEVLRVVQED